MRIIQQIIILIPIYKKSLGDLEEYSVKYSISNLKEGREVRFIAPETLDLKYYQDNFQDVGIDFYNDIYFKSTEDYSRLLLRKEFYENYEGYEYLLIHQTDAILLYDNLDYWCSLNLSYVGAPWPAGLNVILNQGRFSEPNEKLIRVHVGNGGFSLRNIQDFIKCLIDFKGEVEIYLSNGFDNIGGHNEDVFFAAMAIVSESFTTPDPLTASLFATEYPPAYYMQFNGNIAPMAGHAWWKFDIKFWRELINRN